LLDSHYYLLKISEVEDREIFKICLEYWLKLVNSLYHEGPVNSMLNSSNPFAILGKDNPLMMNGDSMAKDFNTPRRALYSSIMSDLRLIMINSMVKPEEVCLKYISYPFDGITFSQL
jgi:exportin-1